MKELKLIIKERVHSTHFEMNIHHVMKEIHTYEDKVILEKNVFLNSTTIAGMHHALYNEITWESIMKEAGIEITEDNEPYLIAKFQEDDLHFSHEFSELFLFRYPEEIYNTATELKKYAENLSAVEMMEKLTTEYNYTRSNAHKIIKALYIVEDTKWLEEGQKIRLIPYLPKTINFMWLLYDINNRTLPLEFEKEIRNNE